MKAIKRDHSTREHLIQKSKKVFARLGYDGATIKDLSAAADTNLSLFSYHFGGKAGLYQACFEEFAESRVNQTHRILTPSRSPEEFKIKLKLWMEELLLAHIENEECMSILHREIICKLDLLKDVFAKTIFKVYERLVVFIRSGQNAHYLREDLEAENISTLIWGSLIHLARIDPLSQEFMGKTIKNDHYRNQMIETAIELFFMGAQNPSTDTSHLKNQTHKKPPRLSHSSITKTESGVHS